MATSVDIVTLREYVNEPTPDLYSDERLGELLDAFEGDLRKTASVVWSTKAARFAQLVNVQEGSSRRDLGDLHEQALSMAKHWGSTETGEVVKTMRPARTRPVVRP